MDLLLTSGMSKSKIDKSLEKKRIEYKDFASDEMLLFLIAKDNGIHFNNSGIENEFNIGEGEEIDYNEFLIDISGIVDKMANIVLIGKISSISPVNEFIKKDQSIGRVGSFYLHDLTGPIRIVVWDEQTDILKSEFYKEGKILQVINAYSKLNRSDRIEVHLSKNSSLLLSPPSIDRKKYDLIDININNGQFLPINDILGKNGFIHEQIIGIASKIIFFKEIEKKDGDKTFLFKFVLSDDSGSIIINIWDLKALESVKIVDEGVNISISKFSVKDNDYSGEKEIYSNKNTALQIYNIDRSKINNSYPRIQDN